MQNIVLSIFNFVNFFFKFLSYFKVFENLIEANFWLECTNKPSLTVFTNLSRWNYQIGDNKNYYYCHPRTSDLLNLCWTCSELELDLHEATLNYASNLLDNAYEFPNTVKLLSNGKIRFGVQLIARVQIFTMADSVVAPWEIGGVYGTFFSMFGRFLVASEDSNGVRVTLDSFSYNSTLSKLALNL